MHNISSYILDKVTEGLAALEKPAEKLAVLTELLDALKEKRRELSDAE